MQIAASHFARPQVAARATREPGPDDVSDPDMPDRRDDSGPDSTADPDFGGRGGDSYSGPDGSYDYDPYH